jgi:hypothetical protein
VDELLHQRREAICRPIKVLQLALKTTEWNAELAHQIESQLADAEEHLMRLEIEAAGW